MKTVVSILGTRPEIIKFSPLLPLLDRRFHHVLIHTGQHYDPKLDSVFFDELRLRGPDHCLEVGSHPPAVQTGLILERLEPVLRRLQPHAVLVLGDTNTALAGGIAGVKGGYRVFHVESGCRSFNLSAPEEQNRRMLDHVSDVLLAPDAMAVRNLKREGITGARVHRVGSTGLDAIRRAAPLCARERLDPFGVRPESYVLVTVHRAENTEDPERLGAIVRLFNRLAEKTPVVFPVHPRTRGKLEAAGLVLSPKVRQAAPLGYLDFVSLLKHAILVLSDSGGVQEEAAVLNTPCLVLRDETEWMRLVKAGKNFLTGIDENEVLRIATRLIDSRRERMRIRKKKAPLEFGASRRILQVLGRSMGGEWKRN